MNIIHLLLKTEVSEEIVVKTMPLLSNNCNYGVNIEKHFIYFCIFRIMKLDSLK